MYCIECPCLSLRDSIGFSLGINSGFEIIMLWQILIIIRGTAAHTGLAVRMCCDMLESLHIFFIVMFQKGEEEWAEN